MARNEFVCWVQHAKAGDDPSAAYSPDPGRARGSPVPALLLAAVRTASAPAASGRRMTGPPPVLAPGAGPCACVTAQRGPAGLLAMVEPLTALAAQAGSGDPYTDWFAVADVGAEPRGGCRGG